MKWKVILLGVAIGSISITMGLFTKNYLQNRQILSIQSDLELLPIKLKNTDGKEFNLINLRGDIVIINFWASWCLPCRKEIPLLQATQDLHANNLKIVGIAIDELEDVRRFEDEVDMSYLSLVAKHQGIALMTRYGNNGKLPFTLVFDQHGILKYRKIGEVSPNDLQFWLSNLQ